ncbi:VOC family protein [Patescibacteria group bacterium]|nr:MAG: VOC family protein [Patescibacteria group bacterium]
MGVKLTGYINFDGNAQEALDFYYSIFGGTIDSDTFGEFNEKSGGAMPVAEEDKNKIMHATLTTEHFELMISDAPSTWPKMPEVSNITLALNGDNAETIQGYWDKLVEGGNITQPLEDAPWGDKFGSLTDKFGVNWMVDISEGTATAST